MWAWPPSAAEPACSGPSRFGGLVDAPPPEKIGPQLVPRLWPRLPGAARWDQRSGRRVRGCGRERSTTGGVELGTAQEDERRDGTHPPALVARARLDLHLAGPRVAGRPPGRDGHRARAARELGHRRAKADPILADKRLVGGCVVGRRENIRDHLGGDAGFGRTQAGPPPATLGSPGAHTTG